MPSEPAAPRVRKDRQTKRRSAIGWFVHRHGWRAYAIPVLAALTVVVLLQAFRPPAGPGTDAAAPQVVATVVSGVPTTVTVQRPGPTTTVSPTVKPPAAVSTPPASSAPSGTMAPDPNGEFAAKLADAALPPGGQFAATGSGTWHVLKGTGPPQGVGPRKFTYTIEVEDGIQSAEADKEFAAAIDAALADTRSWIGGGEFTLQRIDSGEPSFRISLTSQTTIRDPGLCGFQIQLEASCYNRTAGRVMINNARWARGAVPFHGDLGSYRVYAINHEVGHALDFGHQPCGENDGLAPVMMQQSWSTSNNDLNPIDSSIPKDGKSCRFNPYPFPRGTA